MSLFRDVSPGESVDQLLSSARHNAINRLLNTANADGEQTQQQDPLRSFIYLTAKNMAGVDIPRGGVMGLDSPIFDADDNEQGFAGNSIRFVVKKPKEADHGDRFAIATKIIANGKVVGQAAVLRGAVPAKVDIKNESHKHAKIVDDEVGHLESADSGIPMIPAQAGTGVKWAIVMLGGGGAAAPQKYAWITGTVPEVTFNGQAYESSAGISETAVCSLVYFSQGTTFFENSPPMKAINWTSGSPVVGSVDVPIILPGKVIDYEDEPHFLLAPFDLASLEGMNTAVAQGPFHVSGTRKIIMGRGDCQPETS